jgi:hypothetical protein
VEIGPREEELGQRKEGEGEREGSLGESGGWMGEPRESPQRQPGHGRKRERDNR